jgi:hypothetical protein
MKTIAGPFALRFALLLTVPASVALQMTIWDVLYPHHLELLSTSASTHEELGALTQLSSRQAPDCARFRE